MIRVYSHFQPWENVFTNTLFACSQNMQNISFLHLRKLLQTSSQVYSGTVQISNTGFSGSLKNIMRLLLIGLFGTKVTPVCWANLENAPSRKSATLTSAPGNKPAPVTTVTSITSLFRGETLLSPVPPSPFFFFNHYKPVCQHSQEDAPHPCSSRSEYFYKI